MIITEVSRWISKEMFGGTSSIQNNPGGCYGWNSTLIQQRHRNQNGILSSITVFCLLINRNLDLIMLTLLRSALMKATDILRKKRRYFFAWFIGISLILLVACGTRNQQ